MGESAATQLFVNYLLAKRREDEGGKRYARGEVGLEDFNAAVSEAYRLGQEVDEYILSGPTYELAQLFWEFGRTAFAISGGKLERKALPADDPFLMLLLRLKSLRLTHGPQVMRRISGITLRMLEMHTDQSVEEIAKMVRRSLSVVRFSGR